MSAGTLALRMASFACLGGAFTGMVMQRVGMMRPEALGRWRRWRWALIGVWLALHTIADRI